MARFSVMDVSEYLKRISYDFGDDVKSIEPNVGTLNRLLQAHLYNVPFENLGALGQFEYRSC